MSLTGVESNLLYIPAQMDPQCVKVVHFKWNFCEVLRSFCFNVIWLGILIQNLIWFLKFRFRNDSSKNDKDIFIRNSKPAHCQNCWHHHDHVTSGERVHLRMHACRDEHTHFPWTGIRSRQIIRVAMSG